jgi:CRISPR-associated protein Cmr3
MTIYLLEALDTQFYRGTLPFDAGADGFATTEPLPWPSSLYGAWRTAGLVQSGNLKNNTVANHPVWGDKDKRGSFSLKGPLLWRDRYVSQEILLPVPADLVATLVAKDKERWYHCVPDLQRKLAECTDYREEDIGLCRLQVREHEGRGKLTTKENHFLTHDQLANYLTQKLPDNIPLPKDAFPPGASLFHPEPRIGIKRCQASHQAEEGMLYAARHHRFAAPCHSQKKLGYWVHLDAGNDQQLGLPKEGVLKLGGEGRAARYQQLAETDPLGSTAWTAASRPEVVDLIAQRGRFKLYLLTPGLFGGRAHPFVQSDGTVTLTVNQAIQATLVGLATYKPVLIGGWDMQKKFPKPLITGMPAGTVYFFQLHNFPEDADKRQQAAQQVFDALNFQTIGQDDINKEGFGLVLVGGWHV